METAEVRQPASEAVGGEAGEMAVLACPWCGGEESHRFLERIDGRHVLRCASCGFYFVDRRPLDLSVLYDDAYFGGVDKHGGVGYEDYARDKDAAHFAAHCALVDLLAAGEHRRLLDVGCADGAFLDLMRDRGCDVAGVEVSDWGAAQCAPKGIPLVARDIADIGSAVCYDVVTAWDVLEHVADLRSTLAVLRNLMSDQGVFLFMVPCLDEDPDSVGNGKWAGSSLEHVSYFDVLSIRRVIEDAFDEPPLVSKVTFDELGSVLVGCVTADPEGRERIQGCFESLDPERLDVTALSDPDEIFDLAVYHMRFRGDALAAASLCTRLGEVDADDYRSWMLGVLGAKTEGLAYLEDQLEKVRQLNRRLEIETAEVGGQLGHETELRGRVAHLEGELGHVRAEYDRLQKARARMRYRAVDEACAYLERSPTLTRSAQVTADLLRKILARRKARGRQGGCR